MSSDNLLEKAKHLSIWIHDKTNDTEFPNETRINTGLSILQLCLDIYDGIVLLIEQNMAGPAFVLARSMFESYVRGVWLLECASEQEIDDFLEGKYPKLQTIVKKIGDKPEAGGAWIKVNYEKNSSGFNNLAHAGEQHYIRRVQDRVIEPSYPVSEVNSLIKFAMEVQIRVGAALLGMLAKEEELNELSEFANKVRHKL